MTEVTHDTRKASTAIQALGGVDVEESRHDHDGEPRQQHPLHDIRNPHSSTNSSICNSLP
jgi:hypothetical protein